MKYNFIQRNIELSRIESKKQSQMHEDQYVNNLDFLNNRIELEHFFIGTWKKDKKSNCILILFLISSQWIIPAVKTAICWNNFVVYHRLTSWRKPKEKHSKIFQLFLIQIWFSGEDALKRFHVFVIKDEYIKCFNIIDSINFRRILDQIIKI